MNNMYPSLRELKEEIEAMLKVCFCGVVETCPAGLILTLEGGRKFSIAVNEG